MSDTPHDNIRQEPTGRWVGITEAALLLEIHPRTVERRVEAGKLRDRKVDGRPEIWLDAILPGNGHDNARLRPAVVAVTETNERQTSLAVVTMATDARRARRSARLAWSLVAAAAIGGAVATWFITEQAGQLELSQQVAENARMALESGRRLAQDRGEEVKRLTGRLETERDRAAQASARAASLELALVESEAATQVALAKHETVEAKLAVLGGELHATGNDARIARAGQ